MVSVFGVALLIPLLGPLVARADRGPEPTRDGAAARAVTDLVGDPAMKDLDLGVAVRCTADRALWGAHQADQKLSPASGAKLLSTAAVLETFALDHTFATVVRGQKVGAVVEDLTLVGGGDPASTAADLGRLADRLKELGVERVRGGVGVDLGRFAGSATPPAYDRKKTDAAYRPEVPSLGITFGALVVTVRPAKKVGDPVRVTTSLTAPSIVIDNRATTVAGKASDKLEVAVAAGAGGVTRVVVSGALGDKAQAIGLKKRVTDPARVAAEVFVQALSARKIKVEGGLRAGGSTAGRAVLTELARVESRPVADLVRETNTTSNNYMAETLFKQLGVDPATNSATWERAQSATTAALTRLGLEARAFEIVNGSGLYEGTKVSASAMTSLLAIESKDDAKAKAFRASLAVAGESGTLKNRLKSLKGKVRAKTGTLDDALSLSGYVPAARCLLAFSVLVNGDIGDRAPKVISGIDTFVTALAKL
ncbi:MAG: D-alanyl-D-alanine carboxypeptidase/D-alanyl-D-alanine-endopeptidase [Deltaproteobacteria bacterium]|nr:D-alanyl-D-alanine carboxypeptidase/D-alanyl-D-alanine-endopeptidase [Deltaproteobacteria bacterium]